MGINAEIINANDIDQIVEAGILATPGFAFEGEVKSTGRVPSLDEIIRWTNAKR